ncbi:2Fe-2S iron-sulfur cluster-binding protein [Catellatospora sp. KI3]|uniref:2Fe-2S iron-sulfur cluster-binding protein n=1 Tax=Catellatospora sp. KI3 TaxID=3041620 RepID=UPI00248258D2|nr:2Fe-2S iron-sulfur cluster-binding protein [Catellatospora sp. KI3]MDI1461885.1 2Fe-2S iron-sulfur cluster-binding protein [Catellatospora sp. KI3]
MSTTFHELTVASVEQLTPSAVALTLAVPAPLREVFAFRPGQHLTVRLDETERRSYSICSTPADLREHGLLTVGVKRVPGGAFSTRAQEFTPGERLAVLPPLGRFTTELDPSRTRRYGAIVAGSGITPVLSLVATALATEPGSTFTVLCGNRSAAEVMFADALADLKDRFPGRLQLVHVLSREMQPSELLSGRLDTERTTALLKAFELAAVDEWFLCGPLGVVRSAREALAAVGATGRAHVELFHAEEPPPPAAEAGTGGTVGVQIVLDGRSTEFAMERGERVLDAALRHRGELPYACKGGVCSTCRAKVVSGSVEMAANWALEPEELAAGYVLTCQSTPTTDELALDFDA